MSVASQSIPARSIGNNQELSEDQALKNAIAQVFQDSQSSIASHRKQVVVLRQIQVKAEELGLEEQFNQIVLTFINRILLLKKSEAVGDRIIKFISTYTAAILEDDKQSNKSKSKDENDDNADEERTLFGRFVDELVIHAMKGLEASNKNVRYRCLQMLNHLLFQIDEISSDIYEALMELLNDRLHDKDALVRAVAIRTIARFQESDNHKEDDVSEAAEKLLIAIQNDPSADVRKAALLSLEKNPITINYLLERARDTNPTNRRLVFTRIMKDLGDFRTLDFKVREKLLIWGLKDRDQSVSNAAARMFAFSWFEICNNDIMELIGRLHVVQSEIAELAMQVFFQQRADIFPKINFSQELWKSLNPETSFLIRCYYQYCNERNYTESIDKNFPEAIELATLTSKYLKLRKMFIEKNQDDSSLESLEFVIQQLLMTAKDYDYSDEVGRREMFQVLRSSLTNDSLPDKLVKELLQVLRKISIGERDFCQMITEVITDIRDSSLDEEAEAEAEETFHSALSDIGNKSMDKSRDSSRLANNSHRSTPLSKSVSQQQINAANEDDNDEDEDEAETTRPQKKQKVSDEKIDEITLQCLIVTKRMLELTTEPLKEHLSIQSLVDSLIKPAIKCSLTQIRSLGIQCLGLVCLMDKQLSAETMYLLGMCVSQGDDALKAMALRVIFDILSVHGTAGILDIEDGVDSLSLSKLLYRCLRDSTKKEVQSTTAIGICKLYLADILIDNELFETLLLSYFGPNVSENEAFKQALSFCIPVYSFSHPSHQAKIMKISCDTFLRSYQLYENDLDEKERSSMTPPSKILEQLIQFTDPTNVVNQSEEKTMSSTVHLELALELLEIVLLDDFAENRVFKKMVIGSLTKLRITNRCDPELLGKLMDSLNSLEQNIEALPSGYDLPTKNSFIKFKSMAEKICQEAEEARPDRAAKIEEENEGDSSEEQIDLQKAVDEEIDRSMVEHDEDAERSSDEEDEDEEEEEEEQAHEEGSNDEDGDGNESHASYSAKDLSSVMDGSESWRNNQTRRKLPTVADSSMMEEDD